jgi:enoyl-CoA hydratase
LNVDSAQPLVTAWVEDGVGRVRLADPEHRNALTGRLSDQLEERLGEVLAEDIGALVLTAEGSVFCAGGSIDELLTPDRPLEEVFGGYLALCNAPVPTIAAVGGPAIGAGVNLALACDVVVTSPKAKFDPRFLDVGIHPGGGHLWRLQQRIGAQGAAAMIFFGESLDGVEAVRAGLAWSCVDEADLEDEALRMARRAAGRPRTLIRRTKQTMVASQGLTNGADAFELEMVAQKWSMEQPEFHQRVSAIKRSIAERQGAVAGSSRT